jgi:hypothetical protein
VGRRMLRGESPDASGETWVRPVRLRFAETA